MFQTVQLSIIRRISLYIQEWYTSDRFADSLQAGSGCSILILLESCPQTGMTYSIAVCTVKYSWWWTEELSETCRVSYQTKIEKSVHLVGFIRWNLSRCTVTWTSKWQCKFSQVITYVDTKARYFARCLPLCCWGLYDKWQRFANIYVHAHGSVGRLDNQGPALIFSEVTPRSLRILPSVRRAESVQNNTKEPNVLYIWCLPHHGLCLGLFCTTACRPSQLFSKQHIFVVC